MIKPVTSRPGVDPRTPSRQEGVLPIKLMTLYGVFLLLINNKKT